LVSELLHSDWFRF